MPARSFNTPTYKYGFNGKEKDDEIKDNGNSYDFNARIFDSRLGIWLSIDPLASKSPDISPYNFVANNPLRFIDPDGRFLLDVHQRITANALMGFEVLFKTRSTEAREGERWSLNWSLKWGIRGAGTMFSGGVTYPDIHMGDDKSAHFDQMNYTQIINNMDRIQKETAKVIDVYNEKEGFDITNGAAENLGAEIGKNLHSIQDLYSHSNYVELFNQAYPEETNVDKIPTISEALNDPTFSKFAGILKEKLKTGAYDATNPQTGPNSHQGMNHDLGAGSSPLATKTLPAVKEQIKGKKVDWFSIAAEAVATKASKEYLKGAKKQIETKKK